MERVGPGQTVASGEGLGIQSQRLAQRLGGGGVGEVILIKLQLEFAALIRRLGQKFQPDHLRGVEDAGPVRQNLEGAPRRAPSFQAVRCTPESS